jgi:hypothetical protein
MKDPWIFWLLFLAVGLVMIGVEVAGRLAERQRTEQLRVVAGRLGLEFSPESQPQLVERLAHFQPFLEGQSGKAWNVMHGLAGGVKVQLFDHKYTTGGDSRISHTWTQTVLLFESARLQLPAFSLRPQGAWDGVADLFGQQDIELEASPEFSKAYVLQGLDEDQVRAIISEPAVAYCNRHPDLWVEGWGGQLVYYHKGCRMKSEEIPGFFQEGLDVLDLWIQKEGVAENLELIGLDLEG